MALYYADKYNSNDIPNLSGALYYADKYNAKNDMPNLSGISTAFPLTPKTNQTTPLTTKRKATHKQDMQNEM